MKTFKQTVINIHGAGPKHYRSLEDGSGDWQAQLPTHLGSDYKVLSPQMPSPKNPSFEEWKILFEKYLLRARGDLIFVGHSLGGSFLLKYISENIIPQKILALLLVATPFKTIKGFEAPTDYTSLKKIQNIFLYHSMDDVEVPYAHALMYNELMQGNLKTYFNQGHFFKRKEFPDIIQDIHHIASSVSQNTENTHI